jgi:hypothetical protein
LVRNAKHKLILNFKMVNAYMFLLPMMRWTEIATQRLYKKGQGRSIHVSDFLTDTIRRLKLSEYDVDDRIPHEAVEARVIINPGI